MSDLSDMQLFALALTGSVTLWGLVFFAIRDAVAGHAKTPLR